MASVGIACAAANWATPETLMLTSSPMKISVFRFPRFISPHLFHPQPCSNNDVARAGTVSNYAKVFDWRRGLASSFSCVCFDGPLNPNRELQEHKMAPRARRRDEVGGGDTCSPSAESLSTHPQCHFSTSSLELML